MKKTGSREPRRFTPLREPGVGDALDSLFSHALAFPSDGLSHGSRRYFAIERFDASLSRTSPSRMRGVR
ncbi:MAG: hypothetical protein M3494_07745 [Actinomycetota bacterium]|nr:hypothetical protein [Rubrobacter sp.]MDQ3507891.1 hypothetical protein [Actinomycetota bacterium]